MGITGENLRRLIELAGGAVADRAASSSPPAGDPGPRRHLAVVVITHGDLDAVHLTLAGLRLNDGLDDSVGVVVLDTAPDGPAAWALKALEWEIQGLRYLPAGDVQSRTARWDRAFQESNADWVLCLEAPVLLAPAALGQLMAYAEAHPASVDLLQGPQLAHRGTGLTTHLEADWHRGSFGIPACDPRGLDPAAPAFAVPMQALGVLACRADAWVGGNPNFRGEAGAEGYVHEKFRTAGGRTLCLPFLRWATRRRVEAPPTGGWEGHIRNFLVGWEEVGLPMDPLLDHFDEHIGYDAVSITCARWESEKANPLRSFDGIFCINLDSRPDRWERMLRRFARLGIADRVRRMSGVETAVNNHVGCALSHRRVLETARREGLERVLVFEDDAVFLEGALWVMRRALAELERLEWKVLFLGSFASRPFPLVPGCHHLQEVRGLIGLHAAAYHKRVYDELLSQIPTDPATMADWVVKHPVDVFIGEHLTGGMYRVSPMVSSQEVSIPEMDDDLRDQFVFDP